MISQSNVKFQSIVLMSLLTILVVFGSAVHAQEEPTPVPEPAAPEAPEEPAAPAEPATVPEEPAEPAEATTVPEEPAATAEPAEPAEPAAAAEPAPEPEPAVAAIPVAYRQKTLLSVDGKAQMKGVLELVVQPQGGEPTKVRVNVLAKSKPKAITSDLLKELDFAIDDRYKVNRTGDKKIVVKATKKNPPIAITVTTQSLSGVSVKVSNG